MTLKMLATLSGLILFCQVFYVQLLRALYKQRKFSQIPYLKKFSLQQLTRQNHSSLCGIFSAGGISAKSYNCVTNVPFLTWEKIPKCFFLYKKKC